VEDDGFEDFNNNLDLNWSIHRRSKKWTARHPRYALFWTLHYNFLYSLTSLARYSGLYDWIQNSLELYSRKELQKV
jgi:hypothetical protein